MNLAYCSKFWVHFVPLLVATSCGFPQNTIAVKTNRDAAAANCEATAKCVKDPTGLVLYNSDLVTENFILKTPSQSQTLLTRLINLMDEPKLLIMSGKLDPLIRGVRLVNESELCDSPKGIDGLNPTASQLRAFKQGRYKACITYIGDGLFKRAHALPPIDVDTTAPMPAQDPLAKIAVTATSASLTWTKSSDNLSAESRLIYSVYTSKTQALDTMNSVQKYGSIVPGTLVGGTSYIINSLSPDTDYHAAVVVADEAGNQSLVGQVVFKTPPLDATAPTVSISSDRDPGPTNFTVILMTIQFSEPVSGFSAAGINVSGATKGQFTAVDADIYTLSLAATGSSVSAIVPAGSAKDAAGNNSLVSNTWTLGINGPTAAPEALPSAGVYTSIRTVELSSQTPSATIYYTLDGSNPTNESDTYSVAIPVNATTTIKAFAVAPNHNPSEVVSLKYTITGRVAAPTFSVLSGAYGPAQTVELTSATPGAAIYFTDDGSVPSRDSFRYTGPITVSTSKTIKAFAVLEGWDDSVPSSAEYTINGFVDPPTASPQAGTYTSAIEVTLSSATPGANIVYSVDGSVPTMPYSTPILVQVGQTIRAAALKSNFIDSSLAEFPYVITGKVQAPTFSIPSGAYGPAQTVELTSATSGAVIYFTDDGSVPSRDSSRYTGPITVSTSKTIKAFAVLESWDDSVPFSAEYTINGFVDPPTASPLAGIYTSAIEVALSSTTPGASIFYTVDGSTPASFSLVYSGPIFVQVGQTIKAIAVKPSHIDSVPSEFVYTITGTVQKPEFSPPPRAYATAQLVSLTSTTPNAVIYYTTDGSDPTRNSTPYLGPITVSASQTVKAIAVLADWADSAVETAQYTINGPVANPIGDPAPGTYNTVQSLRLLTIPSDAQIYFTTDGSDPATSTSRQLYTDVLTLSSSVVIKARASRQDFTDSETVTLEYNILPAITFSQSSYTLTANISNASFIPTKTNVAIDSCTSVPSLPSGLTLNVNDCSITGTPIYGGPATAYTITPISAGRSGNASIITIAINGIDSGGVPHGLIADPHSDKTVLLMHMDGANDSRTFTDSSSQNHAIAVNGNALISSEYSKFGGSSVYFDGASFLRVSDSDSFVLSNSPFSIEAWFRANSLGIDWQTIIQKGLYGSNYSWSILVKSGNIGVFTHNINGDWNFTVSDLNISAEQWNHVALVYTGSEQKIFLNGVQVGSKLAIITDAFADVTIGASNSNNPGDYFNGYIDDLRITKGVARYSSNFTPPAGALGDACYNNGSRRACTYVDYGCAATGYCSGMATYYIDGIPHPGLNSLGTGTSSVDNKYYVSGVLANGLVEGSLSGYDAAVKSHSPLTYLKLDETTGDFASDSSGNGNNATYYGGITRSATGAFSGSQSSVNLDGSSAAIQLPSGLVYGRTSLSVELWFKTQTSGVLFGYQSYPINWGWSPYWVPSIYIDTDGKLRAGFYIDNLWPAQGITSQTVTDNQWHHVVLTISGTNQEFYLDGSLVSSNDFGYQASWIDMSNSQLGWGLASNWPGAERDYFAGSLDEIAIYGTALTGAQVADHYSKHLPSCYTAGVQRACTYIDYGCQATGYCSGMAQYHIDGVPHPGLNSSGTGISTVNNKHYVDGALANGLIADPYSDKTVLLMHMDGADGSTTFTDSSVSNLSVTPTGNAQISTAQSKFGGASALLPSITTDLISINENQDLTIEMWFYQNSISYWSNPRILLVSDGFGISLWDSGPRRIFTHDGTWMGYINQGYYSSNYPSLETWHHLAVTRENGTLRTFLDGQLLESAPFARAISGQFTFGDYDFNGYIDDLRITKGLARYTSNFTPPAGALGDACYNNGSRRACTYIDYGCQATGYCSQMARYHMDGVSHPGLNASGTGISNNKYYVDGALAEGVGPDAKTVLMLHMDGYNGSRDFVDSSAAPKSASVFGDTYINTSQSKFGGGSAYFDGSGDYLSFASPSDFNFGTGDFTAELWMKPDWGWCNWWGCGSYERALLTTADSSDTDGFLMMTTDYYSHTLRYLAGSNWGWWPVDRSYGGVNADVWHHYAVSRQNGTTRVFLNGSQIESFSDTTDYTNVNQAIKVGGRSLWDQVFHGYIDEVRVTKGMARYTSGFSPDNVAFSNNACYTAGLERSCLREDFACAATGYCSGMSMYYMDGVAQPGLNASGSGVSTVDNKYYVNGALANGLIADPHSDKTVLLMHMDGADGSANFADASISNRAVTRNGNAIISNAQSMFGGSSAYFDGSGSSLWIPAETTFDFNEDFTMEGWFYFVTTNQSNGASVLFSSDVDDNIQLNSELNSNTIRYFSDSWSSYLTATLSSSLASRWAHLAVVRQAGIITIYENGQAVASSYAPKQYDVGGLYIGQQNPFRSDHWFHGYMDEIRVTKGIARYTSNFTPATSAFGDACYNNGSRRACTYVDYGCQATGYCSGMAKYVINGVPHPGLNSSGTGVSTDNNKYYVNGNLANGLVSDPHSDKTVLLMHMDGADGSTAFADSSASNQSVIRNGNAVVSAAQSKFGGASARFNGSGDRLSLENTLPDMGTNDFTVELWFYWTGEKAFNDGNVNHVIAQHQAFAGQDWGIYIEGTSNALTFGSPNVNLVSSLVVSPYTWNHLAAVRRNNELSLYLNGVKEVVGYETTYFPANYPVSIGSDPTGQSWVGGYIDDLRITKGLARYTSNFTPPTEALGSSCYTAGVARACTYIDYGCQATGHCSQMAQYHIDGVPHPGLNASGTGISTVNNKYYVNGNLANGLIADPHSDKTVLLMHMDGADGSTAFTDSSLSSHSITPNGNAQISTAQSKFGGASLYLDGNSSYLGLSQEGLASFRTGDFTIEWWENIQFNDSGYFYVISFGGPSDQQPNNQMLAARYENYGSFIRVPIGSTYFDFTTPQPQGWRHCALVRQNGLLKYYANGITSPETHDASNIDLIQTNPYVGIGRDEVFWTGNILYSKGNLDELRVTKGLARYTSNFTPPNAAFEDGCYTDGVARECTAADYE